MVVDQALDRIARREALDSARQLDVRVERLDGMADARSQEARLFGGAEAPQLELGPNFRRIRQRAHELLEQEIDAAVPRRCGQTIHEPADDAPDGWRKRRAKPSGRRIGEEGRIATKELIAAVAAQRHLDELSSGPRERVFR